MPLKLNRLWREFVPRWNLTSGIEGEVRLKYRTLTVEDVFRAQEEVDIDLLMPQGITQQDIKTQRKYWNFIRYVLSNYTTEWEGIELDGVAVTDGKTIVASAGMDSIDLFGEIVTKIVGESLGTVQEAKNSDGQSEPESSGSGTTADPALSTTSKMLETVVATA